MKEDAAMSNAKNIIPKINKKSLIFALILITINILIIFPLGLHHFTFENQELSPLQVTVSALVYFLYVSFCIFMWIKRYIILAKGFFIYNLVGAFSYFLYFISFIFGAKAQNAFYIVFHSWSIMFEPLTVALGRISGIKAKYITAILYLLLTYISGKVIIAIRNDISYEKKYKEDHDHTGMENKNKTSAS